MNKAELVEAIAHALKLDRDGGRVRGASAIDDRTDSGVEYFAVRNPFPGTSNVVPVALRGTCYGVQLAGGDLATRLAWSPTAEGDNAHSVSWGVKLPMPIRASRLWVEFDATSGNTANLFVFYRDVVRIVRTDIPLDGGGGAASLANGQEDVSVQIGSTMVRAIAAALPVTETIAASGEVEIFNDVTATDSARWRPRVVRELGFYAEGSDTFTVRVYRTLGDGAAAAAHLASNAFAASAVAGGYALDKLAGVPWGRHGGKVTILNTAGAPQDVSIYCELRG